MRRAFQRWIRKLSPFVFIGFFFTTVVLIQDWVGQVGVIRSSPPGVSFLKIPGRYLPPWSYTGWWVLAWSSLSFALFLGWATLFSVRKKKQEEAAEIERSQSFFSQVVKTSRDLPSRLSQTFRRQPPIPEEARRISEALLKSSRQSRDEVLASLSSSLKGLTIAEAELRLTQYGRNDIAQERSRPWYFQMLSAFVNPFTSVLLLLGVVSFVTDVILAHAEDESYKSVIVLVTMIALSGLLRFMTEFRSTKAAESLRKMVRTSASVLRFDLETQKSTRLEIPAEEIVPGDLVHLSAGDMVPGDVRLLQSKDLSISQSILTGESMPVDKFDTLAAVKGKSVAVSNAESSDALEAENICYMGTNVLAGSATGVVVATGAKTYFGSMAKRILGHRSETSFDRGVQTVSWLLIKFMLIMVPVVFFLNGFLKHDWMEAFLFAVAVAVGLTPEMLPMIVSANLAKGAILMSKKKCIVKRMNAIQNLGAMDVLCTDKTGTLTQDKIILEKYVDVNGSHKNERVFGLGYLNSFHQTGLKNHLDRAILNRADLDLEVRIGASLEKVDEIPFDFMRRRMSVVLREGDGDLTLICKGAVEEVVSLCTKFEVSKNTREVRALGEQKREEALRIAQSMNEEGLRVVGVAYREMEAREQTFSVADEAELTLVGFIGFLDPPKESAEPAIRALQEAGIRAKVLTGDNELVTRKICTQVGINCKEILLGTQIEVMTDQELSEKLKAVDVFAKLTPFHKSRIIRSLQAHGHTVGYLGDGINDAAALRDADVGISVDSAADIAKESADIIMLEKNLMVLEQGVLEGRNVFGNIMKYIKMTASSNFGNVFSVLVASAFIPFLPMLPVQLLIQNLLYDLSQTPIPFDRVDRDYLLKPRKWYAGDIVRFMLSIGPISSIFDISTFVVLWFVFGANTHEHQGLFQSGWFIEGLLSQTLIVHMIRTQKIPFIQSRATWPVLLTTAVVMAFGIAIPFTPFGAGVGMTPLPLGYFPWLVGTLLTYCVLTQVLKMIYIRRFHEWL